MSKTPDYYRMSEGDLLHALGIDARKWAEAFCQIKDKQGWSTTDIDLDLMATWFASAIMAGCDDVNRHLEPFPS